MKRVCFANFQVSREAPIERHASGAKSPGADQRKLDPEGADQGRVRQLRHPRRGDAVRRRRRSNLGVDAVERADPGIREQVHVAERLLRDGTQHSRLR